MILFIFAILFIVIGVKYQYRHYIKSKKSGFIETTGTLIDYTNKIEIDNGERRIMYTAIYEFDVLGQKYRWVSNSSSSSIPKKGKQIKLKYNPADPTEAIKSREIIGFIIILVGIIFLVIDILSLIT